jgi:hypothetical protein
MIERKHIPVEAGCGINIVTEQMADGTWAVVASIKHESPTGEKILDLPVRDDRYPSQDEAENAAFTQAREWIDRNLPRAA